MLYIQYMHVYTHPSQCISSIQHPLASCNPCAGLTLHSPSTFNQIVGLPCYTVQPYTHVKVGSTNGLGRLYTYF